jgi:hypothetical protein
MSETQEWEVKFDFMALLAEKSLGHLYDPKDDKAWVQFAEWAGYQRATARSMAKIRYFRITLRARAAVAAILPAGALPFFWKDEERWLPRATFPKTLKSSAIEEELQRLRYETFCGFMEGLPKSVEFDLSNHPFAGHLSRLNNSMLHGYLLPTGDENRRDWASFGLERVLLCYRLQNGREPFEDFLTFMKRADAMPQTAFKGSMNERMLQMVRYDMQGDRECQGAFAAYEKIVVDWSRASEEGREPFSSDTVRLLLGSYLVLPIPWQEDIHGKAFRHYVSEGGQLKDVLELGARRYLLGPSSLATTEESTEENWSLLSGLSKGLVGVSEDAEILSIARPIAEEEDRRRCRAEERQVERAAADEVRRLAREKATRLLFERMR